MASYRLQGKIEGLDALVASLKSLDRKIVKKTVRKMVTKGGQILARAAKQAAPKETGLLRKSIGSKVKVYPSGVTVAIVGPRTGFRQQVTRKRGRWVPKVETANPTKYAHLVELGTARASAKPFLRPAFAGKAEAIREAMRQIAQAALQEGGV